MFRTKFALYTFLFLVSGLLSCYLSYVFQNTEGRIFAGILYTTAIIVLFVIEGRKFKIVNLLQLSFGGRSKAFDVFTIYHKKTFKENSK